ncbi:MAG: phosphate ABC transporter substrate-binding protein [Lachnospiraceae bacterium]|nr:phosphate ABC transporter substrate-binding protein [Lachnospiraceae bacterium]
MKVTMKKLTALLFSLMLVMSFVLSGCSADSGKKEDSTEAPQSTDAAGNEEDGKKAEDGKDEFQSQILFCGSSSLAPIMASIGSSFTDEYVTWDKVDPSFPAENISVYVAPGGSGVGVNSALEGSCDFGMVARTVKDEEKAKMSKDYKEYVMAADALTVSVNKENPVCKVIDDMSTDMIRRIFAGEVTNWKDVDASLPDQEIAVYIRDLSGGAYEVFQKSVMGESEITASATQCPSMGALGEAIAGNKWGIGYASYGVYNQNKDKLQAMKVDGTEPSEETIIGGKYSIQRPLLFITNSEVSPAEQAFIDYVYSKAGADAVAANGYISTMDIK